MSVIQGVLNTVQALGIAPFAQEEDLTRLPLSTADVLRHMYLTGTMLYAEGADGTRVAVGRIARLELCIAHWHVHLIGYESAAPIPDNPRLVTDDAETVREVQARLAAHLPALPAPWQARAAARVRAQFAAMPVVDPGRSAIIVSTVT